MTVTELHTAFKIGMDKIDSLNYPDFSTTEIDFLLNQAVERTVKQRYGLNNFKRQSFEETQKRTEDLKELTRNAVLTPAATAATNISSDAQFVTLPADHWFIIQERVEVMHPDCKGNWTKTTADVIPIQHNEFNKAVKSPFKKPNEGKVLRLMYENQSELIHEPGHVLGNYLLRYIKKPVAISFSNNVTCELSDHIHQEVVDEAIKIALEGIESRRSETFQNTQLTNE